MSKDEKAKTKAIEVLFKQIDRINSQNVLQTDLNITSDYLRLYLGEHSHIYLSFKDIDITNKIGDKLNREIMNAHALIEAGADFISKNGVYKNLQLQLLQLQISDMKKKWIIAFIGAILGALLTNAKDILTYLLQLFHLPPPK